MQPSYLLRLLGSDNEVMDYYPFPRNRSVAAIPWPAVASAAWWPMPPPHAAAPQPVPVQARARSLPPPPAGQPTLDAQPLVTADSGHDTDVAIDSGLVAMFAESRRTSHGRRPTSSGSRSSAASACSCGRGQSRFGARDLLSALDVESARAAGHVRQRNRERKEQMYGRHAASVRALEARLNQGFDRVFHDHHPPLWPSAPLRVRKP